MMKKECFCSLFVFSNLFCFSQESVMDLNGRYEGKNIYVQNPFADRNGYYCVTKVLVNGKPTSDTINASAFSVNLQLLHLKKGDSVHLQIFHHPDCKPKILQDFYDPKSVYEIVSIQIDSGGILRWKTKN